EAMTMATQIGVLDRGRLVQIGTPRAIYADPVSTYVATRLGTPAINLVPRRLCPDVQAPADAATIGVRTEHVRIRKSVNGSAIGRVKWIEHLGDQNHLHVTIADTDVVTLCDRDAGLAVGDAVDIQLTAPLFFSANGERVRAS
ncbi:MAG TPA: TOBE domain-containing protein, partial [Casimicrobiaceae bacterium]|nr:TOBE domain-containing protein [Casimicrobiaceae bacterium]